MRPAASPQMTVLVLAAILLPSPAPAGDQWRIARVWNEGLRKSLDISPETSAESRVEVVPPGRLSLSVGCNDMSTKGLKPDGTALLEPAMMTRMGCPTDIAALETAILGALQLIRSHERTGNEMILRDGEGKEVLALIR